MARCFDTLKSTLSWKLMKLFMAVWNSVTSWMQIIKDTVSVISSDTRCKNGSVRFTMAPFKPLTYYRRQRSSCVYLSNIARFPVNPECTLTYSVNSTQLTLLEPQKMQLFFPSKAVFKKSKYLFMRFYKIKLIFLKSETACKQSVLYTNKKKSDARWSSRKIKRYRCESGMSRFK